ncbi:hypothetical protein A33M_1808 [Rhodovulum sp. PH10]|uniref:type II toxin-antitoxin system PemK/MazF family toxin n=1 Tax=Rhodovulum sp. PH10 TaxID=1187851 RepID=UPI00027C262A|nr:type II toxin-antitoxin system PemK/MazF family toxin [Rhodovulum sp. PH10]EJW12657.1 hypothetical protein A33M_1808 [Rhodovulum sp. PH10]
MAIREHPAQGTILVCDFDSSFKVPEMVKSRCVVVLSPKISGRPGLCTVVCLSTTDPDPVMSYHCRLDIDPPLPKPWMSSGVWVKGDMLYTVGFHRLNLLRLGKDRVGKRLYRWDTLAADQMQEVNACVLNGLGLGRLTRHL